DASMYDQLMTTGSVARWRAMLDGMAREGSSTAQPFEIALACEDGHIALDRLQIPLSAHGATEQVARYCAASVHNLAMIFGGVAIECRHPHEDFVALALRCIDTFYPQVRQTLSE